MTKLDDIKIDLYSESPGVFEDLAQVFSQIAPRLSGPANIISTTLSGDTSYSREYTFQVPSEALPWPRYVSCDFGVAGPTVILWKDAEQIYRELVRAARPPTMMSRKIRGAVRRNFTRRHRRAVLPAD